MEEEKEQLECEKLDKKVRGPLLTRLCIEYGLAPVESEGNNALSENVSVKQEDFIDGDINDVWHKLELDSDACGSPQSKKLKTYHEYKSFLSPCQGRGRLPKQSPCSSPSAGVGSGSSHVCSTEGRMKTKADEKFEKLGETKWAIMKEFDSILCHKVPKDAEKKVMDQLQKLNWCIDINDLAINKNLQKDSFFQVMLSYFPEIQEIQIMDRINKLRRSLSRYVSMQVINYAEVNILIHFVKL